MKHLPLATSSAVRRFCAWAPPTVLVLFTVACGGGGDDPHHPLDAVRSYSSDLVDVPSLSEPRIVSDGAFATSLLCAHCHANADNSSAMRDSASRPIAPFDLWRSSMMSNAVRDPLWRAVVSAEMAAAPTQAEAIQATCFSCHGAMASREGELDDLEPSLGMAYEDSNRAQILLDGVSCTICHQVTSTGLGTETSYAGQFELNARREAYGPHVGPREMPMLGTSGYRPVQALHTTESALCGSCHTVITRTLDAGGDPVGTHFAEQTPYLEWRNSVFSDEVTAPGDLAASCQDCHLPTVSEDGIPIHTVIAARPGPMDRDAGRGARGSGGTTRRVRYRRRPGGGSDLPDRSPFGRHVFVGGNTAVPLMLLANPDELSPNATPGNLQATIRAARQVLREDTAQLSVPELARVGDEIRVLLRVENLAGHKCPTGIPVRRMWIRVLVSDAAGNPVFRSGAHDADGRILGSDGTPLGSEQVSGPIEPHRERISDPDQVQIYESLMADSDGVLTFRLMRAASQLKDNRLLPLGWSADHVDAPRTLPHGEATEDADFTAGQDTISYEIHAPAAGGPYRLEASLLYQTVGQRYAAELLEYSTAEVEAFARYFTPDVRVPEELATLALDVP